MLKYRSAKFIYIILTITLIINIINISLNLNVNFEKVNEVTINKGDNGNNDNSNQIVYDGLTLVELGEKLDKNLNSTLKGYGPIFAKYSIKYRVDPYVATSIVLLETGCKWNCSSLVRKCNNIGGMKGKNKCPGSSYAKFSSLEEGIEAFFNNLSNNYYQKGLTTPKEINKKYAESQDWYLKVEKYVEQIKSS